MSILRYDSIINFFEASVIGSGQQNRLAATELHRVAHFSRDALQRMNCLHVGGEDTLAADGGGAIANVGVQD